MSVEQQNQDTMQHRIFRADTHLTPQEISDLLGIKVVLPVDETITKGEQAFINVFRVFRFAVVTLVLTAVALIGSMYQLGIGPFYQSQVVASTEL
jgi:hypothetical protein